MTTDELQALKAAADRAERGEELLGFIAANMRLANRLDNNRKPLKIWYGDDDDDDYITGLTPEAEAKIRAVIQDMLLARVAEYQKEFDAL